MKYKQITHVLFDMDGVLLDTEPLYTKGTNSIVQQFGKTFNWDTKSKMLGRNNFEAAKILKQTLQLPISIEELLAQQEIEFRKLFPNAGAVKGARELVTALSKAKIPIALATSSTKEFMKLKSRNHQDWFSQFQTKVTGDDPEVKNCKPAPDIFLTAAKRLNAKPESCLVFEDAPTGVKAAISAGMSVIALRDSHLDQALFEGANEIINCLTEFEGEKWGLSI